MTTLWLHATGRADPSEVWQRYAEIARWPTWSPQIRSVESSAPRIGAGVSGSVRSYAGPSVAFTIRSVDESAHSWDWDVRLGPLALSLAHTVDVDPRGTRSEVGITGPIGVVLAYAPLAQLALLRLLRN